ncbi:ROK family glucokinase [Bacillus sp. HMF5848]|uniref:ROK family glucokinase n=1 Tax=Bacillus sp. HMF5848 TaxID=2495421 RepID=UPI000F791B5A|nr:ROK family glucokinase [Bacillus sp. HMF5848]RSK27841.1 ROK family glucokinase [Bacillus sp. HMF5848]
MENKWLVGVDLGGTTIKMAFISEEGNILKKWEVPTDLTNNGLNITRDIAAAIKDKLEEINESKSKLHGIGIGAPGPVDVANGLIYETVNIGWKDFPLKEKLENETGLPVIVDNDANIAAIGEMWKGAGNGAESLIAVTLGTGVGGGIIINGEVVHGINGAGGEIGHMVAVPEGGAQCNCGKTGCLETVASATGIVRIAKEKLANTDADSVLREGDITAKAIFDAAASRDAVALDVIDNITLHLAVALANLANAINPRAIVIGGGVSQAGDILMQPLREKVEKFLFPRTKVDLRLETATLGNDAGVIGGAYLAKTKL